jgi:hypothetical protein
MEEFDSAFRRHSEIELPRCPRALRLHVKHDRWTLDAGLVFTLPHEINRLVGQ